MFNNYHKKIQAELE